MQDRQVCVLGFCKSPFLPFFKPFSIYSCSFTLPSDGEGKQAPACTVKASIASPSQLATVPCRVCTPSSPEIKCIKQCEDGLCQPRIHCLAFCSSTAVESGYKMPSLLKNSSTFPKGVGRVNHSVGAQGIQH